MARRKSWNPRGAVKWLARRLSWILAALAALTLLQVLLFRAVDPPCTVSHAWQFVHAGFGGRPFRMPEHEWRSLDQVSAHLKRAVLAAEDQRFLEHWGFDFTELTLALKDILAERRVRGASTITMQAARSLFLLHSRSLARKAAEAWYTLLMELFWNKRRILEIYLNTVDWGSGIMGAEAASRRYFNRNSADLTAFQAALLAAILPSPHRWSPVHPDQSVRARQQRILRDMDAMPSL